MLNHQPLLNSHLLQTRGPVGQVPGLFVLQETSHKVVGPRHELLAQTVGREEEDQEEESS